MEPLNTTDRTSRPGGHPAGLFLKDVAHTRYAGNCIRDDSEGLPTAGLPVFLTKTASRDF